MPAAIQHQSKAANISAAEKAGRFPSNDAGEATQDVAKVPMELLQKYMKMKETLTAEEKRQLLVGLKKMKSENAMVMSPIEPMNLEEDQPSRERNVIAKKFAVDGEFDPYVNQQRGVQFAPKETDAIRSFQNFETPTAIDPFMVRYEATDDFGNNTTTVVKKHRQGNAFVFTAFTKYDNANPEPEPEEKPEAPPAQGQGKPPLPTPGGKPKSPPTGKPQAAPAMPSLKELSQPPMNNKIMVTKTIVFSDEVQGADILADFLRKLDI